MIVECIANFSEGRRDDVIAAIVAAVHTIVPVLDVHSDPDHNRTVVTFAGEPEAVLEAAFQGIATAARLIDMDMQRGTHPRIGAADVVPFVPLDGATMADCVSLAQRLGQRVGEELSIPVYLYESAATRPERANLADVRRGEYEGLRQRITVDPPNYGPAFVGKAGGVAIGARPPLIAFNVYLTTGDVTIAQRIAEAVRHSSGGLRYVKALGMLVDGKAQVSMNLTDYTKTPLHRVVEMVRREASRYGVGILSSELVGLIPQQALLDAAQWYLQLGDYATLEDRLRHTVSGFDEDAPG